MFQVVDSNLLPTKISVHMIMALIIVGLLVWFYLKVQEKNLVRKQQGYYNYLHGIILSQTNLTKAEKYFKKSLELGLSMDTDLAMANLSLSGIYMQKRRKREATLLLNKAKKLDRQGVLSGQIKQMQQQMKRI